MYINVGVLTGSLIMELQWVSLLAAAMAAGVGDASCLFIFRYSGSGGGWYFGLSAHHWQKTVREHLCLSRSRRGQFYNDMMLCLNLFN